MFKLKRLSMIGGSSEIGLTYSSALTAIPAFQGCGKFRLRRSAAILGQWPPLIGCYIFILGDETTNLCLAPLHVISIKQMLLHLKVSWTPWVAVEKARCTFLSLLLSTQLLLPIIVVIFVLDIE